MIIKEDKNIEILRNGGVGVMPTDTIYGLVGSALKPETVEKLYRLKGRNENKPFIILISSTEDLEKFEVRISRSEIRTLSSFWPGKVSVILPCPSEKFSYLHRGTNSLAFRLPADTSLQQFIEKTGPLVAPSANTEGKPPATTIAEAKEYFHDNIDFYIDGGKISGHPSKIISLQNGKITLIRGEKI